MKFVLTAHAEPDMLRQAAVSSFVRASKDADLLATYLIHEDREIGILVVAEAFDEANFKGMLGRLGFDDGLFDHVAIYESFEENRLT